MPKLKPGTTGRKQTPKGYVWKQVTLRMMAADSLTELCRRHGDASESAMARMALNCFVARPIPVEITRVPHFRYKRKRYNFLLSKMQAEKLTEIGKQWNVTEGRAMEVCLYCLNYWTMIHYEEPGGIDGEAGRVPEEMVGDPPLEVVRPEPGLQQLET